MLERLWKKLTLSLPRPGGSRPRATFRPRLETLEARVVCDNNYWIAPVNGDGSWTTDTNWSLGTHPNAGQAILFDSAHSNVTCAIPMGTVLPALSSVTFGDWSGELLVPWNVTMTASTITFGARSNTTNPDLFIGVGATVTATTALNLNGGAVAGSGTLQAPGTTTVNASSATDKPTLGAPLIVTGTMTFTSGSLPLVVRDNGAITVNANGKIVFNNQPLAGNQSITAISNGDSQAHSIILNGGELDRVDNGECYVEMGVQVNSGGVINVSPANVPGGPDGPLHLTAANSDAYGLDVSGGTVTVNDGLSVDNNASISGGEVDIAIHGTLTLGVGAMSGYSMQSGGHIQDRGLLTAHGGLELFGGTLSPDGPYLGLIAVDSGNEVWLDGGEIDVTDVIPMQQSAQGQLGIDGFFYATAGKIVNNVDTTGGHHLGGDFYVLGDASLSTIVIFSSVDLNPNPGNPNWLWILFSWSGTRTGSFTFSLPAGWTTAWDNANKQLDVTEP